MSDPGFVVTKGGWTKSRMKLILMMGMVFLVGIGWVNPSLARKIASNGPLSAHMSDTGSCEKRVAVKIEAPSKEAFTELAERRNLEKLLGTIRVGFSFECPEVEAIDITGVAKGVEVFQGEASAAGGWILRDIARAGTPIEKVPIDPEVQKPEHAPQENISPSLPIEDSKQQETTPDSLPSDTKQSQENTAHGNLSINIYPLDSLKFNEFTQMDVFQINNLLANKARGKDQLFTRKLYEQLFQVIAGINSTTEENKIFLSVLQDFTNDIVPEAPFVEYITEVLPMFMEPPGQPSKKQLIPQRFFAKESKLPLNQRLVNVYAYRALLSKDCPSDQVKIEVGQDLSRFFHFYAPSLLDDVRESLAAYDAQPIPSIPPCGTKENAAGTFLNTKQLKAQKQASLDGWSASKRILEAKTLLKHKGWYNGAMTEAHTEDLWPALEKFLNDAQLLNILTAYSLIEKEIFDEPLLMLLMRTKATTDLSQNLDGLAIFMNAWAQQGLRRMGYYKGPLNGNWLLNSTRTRPLQDYLGSRPDLALLQIPPTVPITSLLPRNVLLQKVSTNEKNTAPKRNDPHVPHPLTLLSLGQWLESPDSGKVSIAQFFLSDLGWYSNQKFGEINDATKKAYASFWICQLNIKPETKTQLLSGLDAQGNLNDDLMAKLAEEDESIQVVLLEAEEAAFWALAGIGNEEDTIPIQSESLIEAAYLAEIESFNMEVITKLSKAVKDPIEKENAVKRRQTDGPLLCKYQ